MARAISWVLSFVAFQGLVADVDDTLLQSRRIHDALKQSHRMNHDSVASRKINHTIAAVAAGSPQLAHVTEIICPFLSALVHDGHMPVLAKYTQEQLMCAAQASGLPVDDNFRNHMGGNFDNFNRDSDGVRRMNIFDMEGQQNEHLTSTGITDCDTSFSGPNSNSNCPLIGGQKICPTPDKKCGVPSLTKFEEFWNRVDVAPQDNFMSVDELRAQDHFFNNDLRPADRLEGAGGQVGGAHIFLIQVFGENGVRISKDDFRRVSMERRPPASFVYDAQVCCALYTGADTCFRSSALLQANASTVSASTAICKDHQCADGFLKTAPDDQICTGERCLEIDCCDEIVAPPDVESTDAGLEDGNLLEVNASFNLAPGWEALGAGGCNDHGGVTHCKYYQTGGWHRHDIPTFSAGIAAARQACGEEGSRLSNAIGAQYIHLWGWQYCMVLFPPGQGCPSSVRGGFGNGRGGLPHGFYQEWIGQRGYGPIGLNPPDAHHSYCFRKASCPRVDANACFKSNSCSTNLLEVKGMTAATCKDHQCPEGFLKTAPDDQACIGETCLESDCCDKIEAPPPDDEHTAVDEGNLLELNLSLNLPPTWQALGAGGCNDHGGVTHCKYSQSSGWHRWDIPTFSGGIALARQKCGEEASGLPGAIGAMYIHLWGWQFCMVYFPPGMGCPSSIRGTGRNPPTGTGLTKGYYQEWIGQQGNGVPIELDSNTGDHRYCFSRRSCP